jgi:hypothetical protein
VKKGSGNKMASKKKRKRIYYQYHLLNAPDKYLNKEGKEIRKALFEELERIRQKELESIKIQRKKERDEERERIRKERAHKALECLKLTPNQCVTNAMLCEKLNICTNVVRSCIYYLINYEHQPIISKKGRNGGYMYITKEDNNGKNL